MSTYGTYQTTPFELKIRRRFTSGSGVPLKLIKNDINRDILFNDTITLAFSSINPILATDANPGYGLIENENEILLDGHVYKIKQVVDYGTYKRVNCRHEFSELTKIQRYDYLEGYVSIDRILNYLFNGTGWTYTFDDLSIGTTPIFLLPEKFGTGSVMKVFKDLLKRTPIEFNILPNKHLEFSWRIGGNVPATYEYGVNIKSLSTESDSTDLYTRIRGYYMNVIGQDEDNNNIEEWAYVEVINHQLESEYGILEMETLRESDVKSAGEMEYICWNKLYSELKYTIDLSAVDFDVKHIGQTVVVTHPQIDTSKFNHSARILRIKEGLINNELKPVEVEVGNYVFERYEERTDKRLDNIENELRRLKNRSTNFMLSKFMIGNKNILAIPGVILGANTTIPQDITATLEYESLEEFTGVFLTKKTAYKDFYIQVQTYNSAGEVTGTYDYDGNKAALEAWLLPNNNTNAIVVTVMQVPPDEFNEATHKKQILAVKFHKESGGGNTGEYLSEFRIGTVDMLPIASDESEQVKSFVRGEITEIKALAEYEITEGTLTGIFANLKEDYSSHYLSIVVNVIVDGSSIQHSVTNWADVEQYAANITVPNPTNSQNSFTFIVSEVPFADLTPQNIDESFVKAFGVTVKKGDEPEPTDRKGVHFAIANEYRINGNARYGDIEFQLTFEGESESDGVWYKMLNPTTYEVYLDSFIGERVMVIDGIVMGVLTYTNIVIS